ncbi:hypothetical protein Tco_1051439, partial [Tanacetum coccineum]
MRIKYMVEAYVALLNFGEAFLYSKKVMEIHEVQLGLCKSTLGAKVVSEHMQEQGLVTSLVTGNVPVKNARADNVKTQENGTMNHIIFDDILDKPLQLENKAEAEEELTGDTEAIKFILADVSDIEKA